MRKLDRYLEYGAAMLILLLCFYMLVAHWLACIWYYIGRTDADNGVSHEKIFATCTLAKQSPKINLNENITESLPKVQYSWLWKLANVTQSPYSYVWSNDSRLPELINGPPRRTMYVTALYFTMTCMTSVRFSGMLAADEK